MILLSHLTARPRRRPFPRGRSGVRDGTMVWAWSYARGGHGLRSYSGGRLGYWSRAGCRTFARH